MMFAHRIGVRHLVPLLALGLIVGLWLQARPQAAEAAQAVDWSIAGHVLDRQGEPIRDAELALLVNDLDTPITQTLSEPDGTYLLVLPSDLDIQSARIEITRPHFQSYEWLPTSDELTVLQGHDSLTIADFVLDRRFTAGFWIAGGTFLIMLLTIATERLHNTLAALLGIVIIFGVSFVGGAITPDLYILDFERALAYVDFNVIFLLMGMMIMIGIIEETGIFQWLAYQAYRLSGGRAWLLTVILMLITAIVSALLDNVTTMLLMTPITLQIALALEVEPLALILPEVMASNVGGISTLIGTPTNILIGSYAGLGFNEFLVNLTPGVLLALAALIGYMLLRYRKEYRRAGTGISESLLARLKVNARIKDPDRLKKSGIVFSGILVLFVVGEHFHLVPAVTALMGAVFMLLWIRPDIEQMLHAVDWTTLLFFIGLFMVIGAVQEVGMISIIAGWVGDLVGARLVVAVLVLVWIAAFLSGVIANIPFTAAMLPLVRYLTRTIPGAGSQVLFYSLSIGSAMGGNTTLIGASANMVTAGITQRAGYPITFKNFAIVGLPATLITVGVGCGWLLLHFL